MAPWVFYHKRVEKSDELKGSLEYFISAKGPSFLEALCDVDEIVYPRLPAGLGYKDMVLGPYMEEQ